MDVDLNIMDDMCICVVILMFEYLVKNGVKVFVMLYLVCDYCDWRARDERVVYLFIRELD